MQLCQSCNWEKLFTKKHVFAVIPAKSRDFPDLQDTIFNDDPIPVYDVVALKLLWLVQVQKSKPVLENYGDVSLRQADKLRYKNKDFARGLTYFLVITTTSCGQSEGLLWINHDQPGFSLQFGFGQVKLGLFRGQNMDIVRMAEYRRRSFMDCVRWLVLAGLVIPLLCTGRLRDKRKGAGGFTWKSFLRGHAEVLGEESEKTDGYAGCLMHGL